VRAGRGRGDTGGHDMSEAFIRWQKMVELPYDLSEQPPFSLRTPSPPSKPRHCEITLPPIGKTPESSFGLKTYTDCMK
jgi:hypothetical protein